MTKTSHPQSTQTPESFRSVHLITRPIGEPKPSDFAVVDAPLPALGVDEVLVKNVALSVDPYMRGRMSSAKSYAEPYELNQPMTGGAVGTIVAGGSESSLPLGTSVLHQAGWRDYSIVPADQLRVIDTSKVAASNYLGILGMPGLTAFGGLVETAGMQAGDVVFVSGAAGAVGSLVGQLARLRGAAKVIGSAGSPEKVKYLVDTLGFDAAFDYHDGPVVEQLAAAAPEGIDLYFDNVGGEHLEAAISVANDHARFALCGAISAYNATEPPAAPHNLVTVIGKRIRLQGLLVTDFGHLARQFYTEVGGYIQSGDIAFQETHIDGGVDHAVAGFLALLRGANTGKMIIRL
ncbi:MAG: NADP-dependent oxidoreductase [Mycobacteriaceae bacterium]